MITRKKEKLTSITAFALTIILILSLIVFPTTNTMMVSASSNPNYANTEFVAKEKITGIWTSLDGKGKNTIWIDKNDICKILDNKIYKYNNVEYIYVSIPNNKGGTIKGYVPRSKIFDKFTPYKVYTKGYINKPVYKLEDLKSSWGQAYGTDEMWAMGKKGGSIRVLVPWNTGGSRIVWMKEGDITTTKKPDYVIIGNSNTHIEKDIAASMSWGTASNGIRIYMAERGSYNVSNTGYDANFIVYKDKKLIAVFTGCSTLPDAPKASYPNSYDSKNKYSAILKDGEYPFNYGGSNFKGYGHYWEVKNGKELPAIRWNGNAFVQSKCAGIYIHKGDTKQTTTTNAWSVGCLTVKGGTANFYKYIGGNSGTIKIVRNLPAK